MGLDEVQTAFLGFKKKSRTGLEVTSELELTFSPVADHQ